MFNSQVVPLLTYESESWGFQKTEKIHAHLQTFLNVGLQTLNRMIYGDLRRCSFKHKLCELSTGSSYLYGSFQEKLTC